MNRNKFSLLLFVGIALIFALHLLSLNFFLYWRLWWIDLILHFVTGIWMGLAVLWFISLSGHISPDFKMISRSKVFIIVTLSAFIIGAVWEVIESLLGITFVDQIGYNLDTVTDVLSDLAGGMTAYFVFVYWIGKKYLNNL